MALLERHENEVKIVEADPWRAIGDDEPAPSEGAILVSFERLRAEGPGLRARAGRLGVTVPGELEPERLASELEGVSLVEVFIPAFTDGRAYSLARLLRDRFGYTGGLRASGDVLRDQLLYLSRCGFDGFVLAPGVKVDDAIAAFSDFSAAYQPAADDTPPRWRRG